MRPVSTLFGSNPGETFVNWAKLLIIKPAPTNRIKLSATSETTSELRHQRKLLPLVADLEEDLRTSLTSGREDFRVGTTLKRTPVSTETANVNSKTGVLILTSL